jgi:outer membrane protein assembly factor BamB
MQCKLLKTLFSSSPLALCLIVAVGGSTHGGENWTSYRGPTDQGHADGADLPVRWSESQNIAWKTPVPGKAWSSPVIWGDRIWLTNAGEDGAHLSVVCVDKNSGKIVLRKRLHYVVAPQYCHPFNSYASPSPVVEEGRVYVSFGSPYNACLDSKTGEPIWERTDFVCNHFRGAGSSPLIYKNLWIIHFDGSDRQYVVALDKLTGKTVWQTDRSVDYQDLDPETGRPNREGDLRKAFSTPVIADVDGKPILISLGSMALYGYDPETGKELWRVETIGNHSGACRPVVGHGLIFSPMGSGGEVLAVRPDGRGNVTDSHVAWHHGRAVPRRPSLLLVDELLFMVDDRGVGTCLEAKTGREIWRQRIGGDFSASPILAGGKIYFFNQDGKSTVIKAAPRYEVLGENELDEGLMASPAVSGNALYVRTKTHLYRIEEKP